MIHLQLSDLPQSKSSPFFLCSGAFAAVVKATGKADHRPYALKVVTRSAYRTYYHMMNQVCCHVAVRCRMLCTTAALQHAVLFQKNSGELSKGKLRSCCSMMAEPGCLLQRTCLSASALLKMAASVVCASVRCAGAGFHPSRHHHHHTWPIRAARLV